MRSSSGAIKQLLACMQGLEHTDLMVLKPPLPPKKDAASSVPGVLGAKLAPAESFLGRRSGGFCLAFLGSKDGREYLVGAPKKASSPDPFLTPPHPCRACITSTQGMVPCCNTIPLRPDIPDMQLQQGACAR